jgi:hypothetical protein
LDKNNAYVNPYKIQWITFREFSFTIENYLPLIFFPEYYFTTRRTLLLQASLGQKCDTESKFPAGSNAITAANDSCYNIASTLNPF